MLARVVRGIVRGESCDRNRCCCWHSRWAAAWWPRSASARSWTAMASTRRSWKRCRSTSRCTTSTWATRSTPRWCRSQEWPKDKVPRGAISKLEDLEGRRPRTAIIEGEPILEGKLLAPGQVADPITLDSQGHAAEDDRRRRRKERRRLARPWRPRRRAAVRPQGRAQRHRNGQVEDHSAEHSRVRRRPDRAALAGWRRRTHDCQDRFADADARAGQQAVAGRADRRAQPDSA